MADDEWAHLVRFDVDYLLEQSDKKVKEFAINLCVAMKKSEIPPGWKECQFTPCGCGSLRVIYRVVESSDGGHSDEQYKCTTCGKTWWIDGSDY